MKTWMITGASRGLGAKMAQAALQAGDRVVGTSRQAQSVLETLGNHPKLLALSLDVTDEAQAVLAAQKAVEHFGSIDVLVNNAGFGLLGAVEEASAEEIERLYRTNVFGLLAVTRAVLPHMRRQRSGHILNFSSIGGYQSGPGFGVYCSTKFAVEGLSEALAAELAPLGIKVTVVEPGYFRTDFLDERSLSISQSLIDDYSATAGQVRQKARVISHNQPGDPDKLAQAVLQLAGHPEAPVRLPLGSDTVAAIRAKNQHVEQELERWLELSLSTDFARGDVEVELSASR